MYKKQKRKSRASFIDVISIITKGTEQCLSFLKNNAEGESVKEIGGQPNLAVEKDRSAGYYKCRALDSVRQKEEDNFMGKRIITFDCYGTLIDTAAFEEEIGRIAEENGLDGQRIRALFACNEARLMYAEPFRNLDELIPAILERCDMQLGIRCMARYGDRAIEAQKALRPFPEVTETLRALKERGYSLVLMSNSCHCIMASNAAALGNPFERLVLAEDVKAYKPQLTFFQQAESLLDLKNAWHCHVAQGYFYDMIPAARMGWKRLWVNRGGELGNAAEQPYTEVRALDQILPLFP